MLKVQEFLFNGGTLEGLQAKFAISTKRHSIYNNLVLLKYSQTDSPFSEEIVRECRGLILDENHNWAVVARAFDKFFNYGEEHAPAINWATAKVQEKVDGTLCLVFKYKGAWHVATTGTPDASGGVNNQGLSFADYFWQTMENRFLKDDVAAQNFCFTFELTGPLNRVVVPHAQANITLLGARNTLTWREFHPSMVSCFFHGVPVVKEFGLNSIEEITASFAKMSPLSQEGYVIVWQNSNGTFGRVKCKHPGYVALHHAKDGMSTKAFVEIARSGETSEVIAAFPEFKPLLDEAKHRYDELLTALEADYAKHKDITIQKDFALAVKSSRCPAALFAFRADKVKSIREFLAKCHIDAMMRMLGY